MHNFNSIKVQLKPNIEADTWKKQHDFNSIKVQLKLSPILEVCLLLKFQFHKGTIKTCLYISFRATKW